VHKVHSKGEGLFDSLMRWIELFLTVVREGLGDPISLEFLLPHTGKERTDILAEIDAVALYHYKLKVAYEDKIRRRFGKAKGQDDADAEDEATQALVQGVVGEISFGELVTGDALDIAAEETDDSDDSSTEYETGSDSDESEESSEEHAVPAATHSKPIVAPIVTRSQTVSQAAQHPPRPHPHHHTASDDPHARSRSLSLKSSKSMTFSRSSRLSQDLPPVPTLPKGQPMSKPLPPSPRTFKPRQHSSTDDLSLQAQRQMATSLKSRKSKGKKAPEALKAPELHQVPKLLPVFTEMVSQTFDLDADKI
jgi:hypothetical protein